MALDRDELAARATAARAALVSLCEALSALVPVAPASGAPATEPRRTVGAVVRWAGFEFIVVKPGEGDDVLRRLSADDFVKYCSCDGDTFVRWATREECERHGIPYVARPLPGAPLAAPSPAATPAAWVPSVGDVVALTNDDGTGVPRPYHDLFGAHLYRVVKDHVGDDGCLECVRVDGSDTTSPCWISPGAMRPATSSERAAAGLPVDESACHGECDTPPPGRCSTGCAPDERPAFDEAKEREAARVAVSRDAGDDFTRGWLARARVAAKGGAS